MNFNNEEDSIISEKKRDFKCPDCSNSDIYEDYEKGEFVCINCGLVIDNLVFSRDPPILNENERIYLYSLAKRSKFNNSTLKRVLLFRKQLNWNEKSRLIAAKFINKIGSQLEISKSIQSQAIDLYSKAQNKNLIKGSTIILISIACLYLSCQISQNPIHLYDLANITNTSIKKLTTLTKKLKLELKLSNTLINYSKLLTRFCSDLNLNQSIENLAHNIASIIFCDKSSLKLIGKSRVGIIAAIIYISCEKMNQKISQKKIAKILHISDVTLRARIREIINYIKTSKNFSSLFEHFENCLSILN